MKNIEHIKKRALEVGFTVSANLDCTTIKPMKEVRKMCSSNKCNKYGKNWACPPGCGTLEECTENINNYKYGIIVQTVGELEDSFDYESMMEIQEKHNQMFKNITKELREEYPNLTALGAGCCLQCGECTYPNSACRFPQKAISSMEAYGMLVSQVCSDNNIPYYYGTGTLAYTGCFLIE